MSNEMTEAQVDGEAPRSRSRAKTAQPKLSQAKLGEFKTADGAAAEPETAAQPVSGATSKPAPVAGSIPAPIAGPVDGSTSGLPPAAGLEMATQAVEYWVDFAQRTVLFWDVMRKRGNQFLEHRRNGCPPVLQFDYEVVLDGRTLDNPVNYALLRILPDPGVVIDNAKRPYVVVDPRAGHGPGIGGSKKDSQIGVAMKAGHPVYFVTFFPEPMPGQTIPDVAAAEAKFLEVVASRHPKSAGKPCVVGNCQAGWAVAMLGAAHPDVTGPIIINGAPMSYWAGREGKNPMRYSGGLYGGTWMSTLVSDLGNGKFDGAYLVQNFESLNPANTLWTKQYNLFSKVDSEEQRYLEFERWWGGFFLMNRDEMSFIVQNLFVGNKLGSAGVTLDGGKTVDLRNIKSPIVVFASAGDNITPPQQALNWISDVYGDDEAIKLGGHVIVYMLHQDIGHLGIFVSGKVAQREHSEIVGVMEYIEMLPPGLYEMIIEDYDPELAVVDPLASAHTVRFAERSLTDIQALDDGRADEEDFKSVNHVSKMNEDLYDRTLSPLIRAMSNETSAQALREMHPLRLQRTLLSDLNPALWAMGFVAESVRRSRMMASANNPFVQLEQRTAKAVEKVLNGYRDRRDEMNEKVFKTIYGPHGLEGLLANVFEKAEADPEHTVRRRTDAKTDKERARLMAKVETGGFDEALVRIIAAVVLADGSADRREFQASAEILSNIERMKHLDHDAYRKMFAEQSYIVHHAQDRALAALRTMLPDRADRLDAMMAAEAIALADLQLTDSEQAVLTAIRKALEL